MKKSTAPSTHTTKTSASTSKPAAPAPVSALNPLRELLNTILRELGEKPYFAELNTAAVELARGPRKEKSGGVAAAGSGGVTFINNTNVHSEFNANDPIFNTSTYHGNTAQQPKHRRSYSGLVAERIHTPNYNFLKQHLLDLTNWCLARGSHYNRLGSSSPSACAAEEIIVSYWDSETIHAVLSTIAAVVRHCDDVGVYSPAASFASANLRERLLMGKAVDPETFGDTITSIRTTTQSLLSAANDDDEDGVDDTGLSYIAPLRLCTPSEVLHLLHICAEAATCFTVIACAQLDMPRNMLAVYTIDPTTGISMDDKINHENYVKNPANNSGASIVKLNAGEINIIRAQMRRTIDIICESFAQSILIGVNLTAPISAIKSKTVGKEPKTLYFMWLLYKTISEAINGSTNGGLDSVIQQNPADSSSPHAKASVSVSVANAAATASGSHHDPLSQSMNRSRSRSTQAPSPNHQQAAIAPGLARFLEDIRRSIQNQQDVESILSPLRRKSMVGVTTAAPGVTSPSRTIGGSASTAAAVTNNTSMYRARAGSRKSIVRMDNAGPITYRHPQYFPLVAELLNVLCLFWKKKAYGLVKTVLSPFDTDTDPLRIAERNARSQIENENASSKKGGKQQRASSRGASQRGNGSSTPRAGAGGRSPQIVSLAAPATNGTVVPVVAPRTLPRSSSFSSIPDAPKGIPRRASLSAQSTTSSTCTATDPSGRKLSPHVPATRSGNALVTTRLQLYERLLNAEQRRQERLLANARDGGVSLTTNNGPADSSTGTSIFKEKSGPLTVKAMNAGEAAVQSIALTTAGAAGTVLNGTVGTIKSTTISKFFANRKSITESLYAEFEMAASNNKDGGASVTSGATFASANSGLVGDDDYIPMSQREPIEHESDAAMAQRLSRITDCGRSLGGVYAALDSKALLSIKKEFVAVKEAAANEQRAANVAAVVAANKELHAFKTLKEKEKSAAVTKTAAPLEQTPSAPFDIAEAKKRSLLPTQFVYVSGGEMVMPQSRGDSKNSSGATPAGPATTPNRSTSTAAAAASPTPQPPAESQPKFYVVKTPEATAPATKTKDISPVVPAFMKNITKTPANAQLGVHPPPSSAADMLRVINKEDLPLGIVRLKASIVGHNASSLFLACLHAERFCYAQALHSMHGKLSTIESVTERRRTEREWIPMLAFEVENAVNMARYQHTDLIVEVIEADLESDVYINEESVNGSLLPKYAASLLDDPATQAAEPNERLFIDILRQRLQVDNLGFASKRLHAHRHFTPVSFVLESTLRQLLSPILLLRLQRAVYRFRRSTATAAMAASSPGSKQSSMTTMASGMNHNAYSADAAMFETFGRPTNIIAFALLLRDDAFATVVAPPAAVTPTATAPPPTTPRGSKGSINCMGGKGPAPIKTTPQAPAPSSPSNPLAAAVPPKVNDSVRDVFLSLWEVVAHTFMKHNKVIGYRQRQQQNDKNEALKRNGSGRTFSGLQSRTNSGNFKAFEEPSSATEKPAVPAFSASDLNSARSDASAFNAANSEVCGRRNADKFSEEADQIKNDASRRQRILGTLLWMLVSLSHYLIGDANGNHGAPLIGVLQTAHRCFPLVVEILDFALCVKQEAMLTLQKIEAAKAQLRQDAQAAATASAAASHIINLANHPAASLNFSNNLASRARQASDAPAPPRESPAGDNAGFMSPMSPFTAANAAAHGPQHQGNSAQHRAAHNALLVPQLAMYESLLLIQGIIHHGLEVSDTVMGTFSNRHLLPNNLYSHNFYYLNRTAGRATSRDKPASAPAMAAAPAASPLPMKAAKGFGESNTDPLLNTKDAALAQRIAKLIRPSVENQIHTILSLVFLQHSSNTVASGIAAHARSVLLAFSPGAHHFQVAQQMSQAVNAANAAASNQNNNAPPPSASGGIGSGNSTSQRFGHTPANSTDGRSSYPLSARPFPGGTPKESNLDAQNTTAQHIQVPAPPSSGLGISGKYVDDSSSSSDHDDLDEMAELRKGLLELKARMQPYIDDQRRVDSDLNGSLRDLTGIIGKYRQATSTSANGAHGAVVGNTFYWPQGMPPAMLDSINYVSEMAWLSSESGGMPVSDEYASSLDASDTGAQSTTNTEYDAASNCGGGGGVNSSGSFVVEPSVFTDFGYISLYLLPLPLLYLHQVRLIRHYRCVQKYYSQRLRVWLIERQRRMEMKGKIRLAKQAARELRQRKKASERRRKSRTSISLATDMTSPPASHTYNRRESIDTQPPLSAATSYRRAHFDNTASVSPSSPNATMRTMDMSMATTVPTLRRMHGRGGGGDNSDDSDADVECDIELNTIGNTFRALGSTPQADQIPSILGGLPSNALMPTSAQLMKIVQDQSFYKKRERRLAEMVIGKAKAANDKDASYFQGSRVMDSDEDESSGSSSSEDDFIDAVEQPLFVFYDFAEHDRLQEFAQAEQRSARGTASNASSTGFGSNMPPAYYHNDHPLDFLLDPYLGCALVMLSASASYLDDDQGQDSDDDDDSSVYNTHGMSTEFAASSPMLNGLGAKGEKDVNVSCFSDDSKDNNWGNTIRGSHADFGGAYNPNGNRPSPIEIGKFGIPLTAPPTNPKGYTMSEIKRRLRDNYSIVNKNFSDYEGHDRVIQMNELFVHQKHNFRSVVLLLSNEMLQLVEDSISMGQKPTAISSTAPIDSSGAPSHNNCNSTLMTTMINGVSNTIPSWMRLTSGGNPAAIAAMQSSGGNAGDSASPDRATQTFAASGGAGINLRGSFGPIAFAAQQAASLANKGSPVSHGGKHGSDQSPTAGGSFAQLNDLPPQHDVSMMSTNPQLEEASMMSHAYSPIMARPKWKVTYFRFLYVLFLQQYHSKAFLFAKKERAKSGPSVAINPTIHFGPGLKSQAGTFCNDSNLGMTAKTNFSHLNNFVNDVSSSSDDDDDHNTPERQKLKEKAPYDTVSPKSAGDHSSGPTARASLDGAEDEPVYHGLRSLLDADPMVKSNFIVERQVTNEIKTLRRRHNRSYYRCWDVLIPRQQMLVGKFTERMVTFLLSAIRLMVELDDENCFVLQPRKRTDDMISARPNRGRGSSEGSSGVSGFTLERLSLRDRAYKMGIVPTLTKEIDLENTMHEMQHRQMKRRKTVVAAASFGAGRLRGGSASPASPGKMGSLFTPSSPQKPTNLNRMKDELANQNDTEENKALAMMGLPSNTEAKTNSPPSATIPMIGGGGGAPHVPFLRMPAPGSQSPRANAQTPTSARGGLPPLHPMSSRGTPRLAGIPALSPRMHTLGSPRSTPPSAPIGTAAAAPAPAKPKMPFSMPKLALNLAPPPIYYTSSGDTAAAAEGELSNEQAQAAASSPGFGHSRVQSQVDFTLTTASAKTNPEAPAPAKPKLPFAMPKLALNLAPPPIYYTSSGDTAAAAEGQLSTEQSNFGVGSSAATSNASPPAPSIVPAQATPPQPFKPKLPFAMPKLALNLAPPPIYYTSSGDTAAAAEGQLSDALNMHAFGGAGSPAGSPMNSMPPSQQASPPQATKPKAPFAMPKLKLSLAPPPIYYTSTGDTAAAAEGQLSDALTINQQQFEVGSNYSGSNYGGSMSPPRAASVPPLSFANAKAPEAAPQQPAPAAAPAQAKPKLPFAMPKLALNLAPPPIYYTSSGDTAAAAEGQLTTEQSSFGMERQTKQRVTPPTTTFVPPVQIGRLNLGGVGNTSNSSISASNVVAANNGSNTTPRIATRSPRMVSLIEEPITSHSNGNNATMSAAGSPMMADGLRKPEIPLIPILRQNGGIGGISRPPSSLEKQDSTTPHSESARGDAPISNTNNNSKPAAAASTTAAATAPPAAPPVKSIGTALLNMKRLQISPHTHVVSPDDDGDNSDGETTADRSADRNGGDLYGASPRGAVPGMGDMRSEERNNFQSFVSGEAISSTTEEETLAELLGRGNSATVGPRGYQGASVFFPSALVSDNERRFGAGHANNSYTPLEVATLRNSTIQPLIAEDSAPHVRTGTGFVSSPTSGTINRQQSAVTFNNSNPNNNGNNSPQQSSMNMMPNKAISRGSIAQFPRASSVIGGESAVYQQQQRAPQHRPFAFGRTESISGASGVGSPTSNNVPAAAGSFVADRGTYPIQLLLDTNAFAKHQRRSGRPIYASLHVHAQVLYLLITLLLRGLNGTSNPIIHPSANISKPSRRGPQHHAMAPASRNNATCGTLDERYSAAFSNLINNPSNSAGVAVGGVGGGQNVLHPLHKHINHALNQPAVRHLQHLIQSENLNQGLTVLIRLLTACGQSEANNGLPASVLGRFYMGLDSSNQGQTASNISASAFVSTPLLPLTPSNQGTDDAANSKRGDSSPVAAGAAAAANSSDAASASLAMLPAPKLSDLHSHSGTSTVVNIPMGAKMIGKGGYGTVLASNVAVVYSANNDALPNPAAAAATPEQLADQTLFQRFVGSFLFGDATNVPALINSLPVTSTIGAETPENPHHSMSFPITPSTTIVDQKLQITKTPSIVSLPVAVKLISVPTFAEDRCALYSLHSEVLIMLRAQDGGRYRNGNALNAALVGNPSTSNCSELLDFGCSGNQYYVVMKRYPTSVKDWRERLVWESSHLVKGRKANLNIEVSEALVARELAAAAATHSSLRRRRSGHAGGDDGSGLDTTLGTMTLNDLSSGGSPENSKGPFSGNVSTADDRTLSDDNSSYTDDSDDEFRETKEEKRAREERREKERLAEKIKEQIFDCHKSVSNDVLWLAATKPASTNLSPEQTAAAVEASLISGKPTSTAIPELKNPVMASMFPVLAHLFIQMLDTILALHQRSSTIHYDIKCDNFFLDFSDCTDRDTEDLVKETLACAGGSEDDANLFAASMNAENMDPRTIAMRERISRLNGWAEEALMMDGVRSADGTLPRGNLVKVRLGDFGESYINSQFANRQPITAQTQKARLERYRRLYEKQKQAINKIRQSVRLGKAELSDDEDTASRRDLEDDYMSDDLSDHFIAAAHGQLANAMTNAAARGEYMNDDDRYESASDEGGNEPAEDRRHSSDPDTDPEDAAPSDHFDAANKRSQQIFANQTPVPAFGVINAGGAGVFGRRMSLQPPVSARSGSGNRSSYEPMSARMAHNNKSYVDSPTNHTPFSGSGLPPSMHLKLNNASRSSPVNNHRTPLSARFNPATAAAGANPNTRRGGPMILQLALAQTARVMPASNNGNSSAPNSARAAPSARYGYGNSMNPYGGQVPATARNAGGNKASATSKLDKRYARGTEIIRPPELLLPHKFLADRRRRTHRTGYESDIWAVGCLLYELLTGDFLFYENLFPKMLARVTNHEEPLMEDSHREMLNNDTDIINFLQFVLTRDPQRRPLLTEVRRRFVLLAQRKLQTQFNNVRAHLAGVNPKADPDHIARLANALGFSAKIPAVLTKNMMLPVECRKNVIEWTLTHYNAQQKQQNGLNTSMRHASSTAASAFAGSTSPSPVKGTSLSTAPGQSTSSAAAPTSTSGHSSASATAQQMQVAPIPSPPSAIRTFHTFIIHSMLTNEMMPLFKAWRAALAAGRQGLTGVCLPIAEASAVKTSVLSAASHLPGIPLTSAFGSQPRDAAAEEDVDHDPLIPGESVEAILESAQTYNLSATVAAQRVNGYKRDAMVGARGWEEIEREKNIANAMAELAFGANATGSPLNNIISAASIPDALYGANPIVNVTNLISILANSYLVLGLETDDADAIGPEFPFDDAYTTATLEHSVLDDLNSELEEEHEFDASDSEEESLANSVISEFPVNEATQSSPRLGICGPSVTVGGGNSFGTAPVCLGAAVGVNNASTLFTARGGGGANLQQRPKITPEVIQNIHNQKPASSAACSVSVRTLQHHGITHVLSFGPLPGVSRHFHYLDMGAILSKYEAEATLLKTATDNGTLDNVVLAHNKANAGKAPVNRDDYVRGRLKPLHNSFIGWMVHGAGRAFCEHAASICGRVLVVPMIVMPTSIPRWVPMPTSIVCQPDTSCETVIGKKKASAPASATTPGVPPNVGGSAFAGRGSNSPGQKDIFASPRVSVANNNSRLSTNSAQGAAAVNQTPQSSVDMTLVFLLIHLTQTHRVPIITAMAHISSLCPILFQAHSQHRYLADSTTDMMLMPKHIVAGMSSSGTRAPGTPRSGAKASFPAGPVPVTMNAPFAFDVPATAEGYPLVFVRASAPIVIDPVQCVQAAVSILELYRMLTPPEFAAMGIHAPPPSYQLMSGPTELPVSGCANPIFGPFGGNQVMRDRMSPLMNLAFTSMYNAFEKKAKGSIKNYMANASASLKSTFPSNDTQSIWNLVVRFVAKHLLSDEGTSTAPKPLRPSPLAVSYDDSSLTAEEKKRAAKAAQIYSPIMSLKLRMQWHRCLCSATLFPTVSVSPSTSFFKEGTTPLFASEHAVATQKLILFDRHPAPPVTAASTPSVPITNGSFAGAAMLNDPRSASIGSEESSNNSVRRPLGPKARHHQNLSTHARWLVNESILPFAAKTRYVHGETAVRRVFPTATTATCALAPQTNLIRCAATGSSASAPYAVALRACPSPESVQWQPVARKPTQALEKDKPYSPIFTILVAAIEGFIQRELIAARKRVAFQQQRQKQQEESFLLEREQQRAGRGTGSTYVAAFATDTAAPSPAGSPSPARASEQFTSVLGSTDKHFVAHVLMSANASPTATLTAGSLRATASIGDYDREDDNMLLGIDTSDYPVITHIAVALAEVVLSAVNTLCAFPDAHTVGSNNNNAAPAANSTSANAGQVFSCKHCGMPTHVRLPNDLPQAKDLSKEERDLEAEEGSIVTSRIYAICPRGLLVQTPSNCNAPDPLLQSWFVHQHMHPRPE